MNGPGHRISSQAAWFGAAILVPRLDWFGVLCGAAVASSCAADDFSPDEDQGRLAWMFSHRGPTHMPEIVGMLSALVIHLATVRGYGWFGWAAVMGWSAHLFADALFGKIPLLVLIFAKRKRVGFTLDTGGRVEAVVSWLLGVACIPLSWLAFRLPGSGQVTAWLTSSMGVWLR